jgi:hypothetical protein
MISKDSVVEHSRIWAGINAPDVTARESDYKYGDDVSLYHHIVNDPFAFRSTPAPAA